MDGKKPEEDDGQIRFLGRASEEDKRQPIDRYGRPIQQRHGRRPQSSPVPHQKHHREGRRADQQHPSQQQHPDEDHRHPSRGPSDRSRHQRRNHRYTSEQGTTLLKALVSYQWASRTRSLAAILAGRVMVGNEIVRLQNYFVRLRDDMIAVDGQVLQRKSVKPVTIVFHKPKGLPGSKEDGVETLYSHLTNKRSWFTPCGVLPATASGIVIVSNDKQHRTPSLSTAARLSQDLWVKVHTPIAEEMLQHIRQRMRSRFAVDTTEEGGPETDLFVEIGQLNTRTTWLVFKNTTVALRDISPVLKEVGLEVLAWERRRVGPFSTDELPPGAWFQLDDQQIVALDELVESGIDDRTPLDEVWDTIAQRIKDAQ